MNRYKTVYALMEDGPYENKIRGLFENTKDAIDSKLDHERTLRELKVTYVDYRIEEHKLVD